VGETIPSLAQTNSVTLGYITCKTGRTIHMPQTVSERVVLAIELSNVQNMHIAYKSTIEYSSAVELSQYLQQLPERRDSSVVALSATTAIASNCPTACWTNSNN